MAYPFGPEAAEQLLKKTLDHWSEDGGDVIKVELQKADVIESWQACLKEGLFHYFSDEPEEQVPEMLRVAGLWAMFRENPLSSAGEFELLCQQGCENSIYDAAAARFEISDPDANARTAALALAQATSDEEGME